MSNVSFSHSVYDQQMYMADQELSAFVREVTDMYGPEQARLSGKDWLDESDLMDSPPRSESRTWRSVTAAASARLAERVKVPLPERMPLAA